jgi:hypothetical protein
VRVVRFEEAIVDLVHLPAGPCVDAEKDAVSVALEETPGCIRLPTELRDARADVHVQVRTPIEQLAHPREILGVRGDVSSDERGLGMARHEVGHPSEDGRESGIPRARKVPIGVLFELLPPFVLCVERLEERHRIGHVDHHGQPQLGRRRPENVETRIVDPRERSSVVFHLEPERLPDLEPFGSARGLAA